MKFDFIFADTLSKGHDQKVVKLIDDLKQRKGLIITKQNWATVIVLAVKIKKLIKTSA